jgi:hypothetical protein
MHELSITNEFDWELRKNCFEPEEFNTLLKMKMK